MPSFHPPHALLPSSPIALNLPPPPIALRLVASSHHRVAGNLLFSREHHIHTNRPLSPPRPPPLTKAPEKPIPETLALYSIDAGMWHSKLIYTFAYVSYVGLNGTIGWPRITEATPETLLPPLVGCCRRENRGYDYTRTSCGRERSLFRRL